MAHFEKISKYADVELTVPVRGTERSAGYDFEVAEDTVVPSYLDMMAYIDKMVNEAPEDKRPQPGQVFPLEEINKFMKQVGVKPTLVPTGMKCKLAKNEYLELSVRSSTPLKHWLILANGIGVIDADYYNNGDNEGHIYFQLINLSPFNIILHKGDKIGQGIIHKYITTDDDSAKGTRKGGFGSTTE